MARRALDDKFYVEMGQLAAASARGMSTFRTKRWNGVSFSQAGTYSDKNPAPPTLVNKIEQWRRVLFNLLVPNSPKVMVGTVAQALRPAAASFEAAINHTLEEIGFQGTITSAVNDALMAPYGMVETGISISPVEALGAYSEMGRVYCDYIDFEKTIIDLKARRMDQMRFLGHEFYWMVHDIANFAPISERFQYLAKNGDLSYTNTNPGGDPPIQTIGVGYDVLNTRDPYNQFCIRKLYLPYENEIVLYAAYGGTNGNEIGPVLSVEEYDGPEGGPFDLIYYFEVNGNIMPSPPVSLIAETHTALNAILQTATDQAESQKDVAVFPAGCDDDVAAYNAAGNGDAIALKVSTAKDYNVVRIGGANPINFVMMNYLDQQCNDLGGNVKTLAGLGSEADTAHQEAILNQNSNKIVQFMSGRTVEFMSRVIKKKIAHLLWYKDNTPLPLSKRVPEAPEVEVPIIWDEREKEGDFIQYNFSFDLYSEQNMTPAMKAAVVDNFWKGSVMPFAQYSMATGNPPNQAAYTNLMAKLTNVPELRDLYSVGQAQPILGTSSFIPSMPSANGGEYTHISKSPGKTPQQQQQKQMGDLLGDAMRSYSSNGAQPAMAGSV